MSAKSNDFLLKKLNFTKKRLNSIYQQSPLAFISWNRAGDIIDLNNAAVKLLGWRKKELINRDFISTIIAEEDRDVWRNWENGTLEQLPADLVSKAVQKNGELITCTWNNAIIEEDNNVEEVISIAENLSNELEKEFKMMKLVKAINETDNWVVITDQNGIIEYANTTVKDITGYENEELIGKNPVVFKSGKHQQEFYANLWQTIKSGEVFNDVIINKKKNGELFYSEQTITPIKDHNNKIINYISVGRDITQNEKLKRKIEYLANYDIIFNIPNRKALNEKIDNLITLNNDSEHKLAVLVVNINRIKYLNDIYGQEDEKCLISLVTNLMNQQIKKEINSIKLDNDNYVSYLGGDNFAMLLNVNRNANLIYKFAETILGLFVNALTCNNEPFMLNAKIGISIYPDDCISSKSLVSNAEIALINIEENDYAFFDEEMNLEIKAYTRLEAKLDRAIKNDEFIVYYQPYYTGSGRLFAMEALLRWHDPERGIIAPAEFMPILENSLLIKRVGLIVIKKVTFAIKQWLEKGFPVVPVSINLSTKQLEDLNHLHKIYKIIKKSLIKNELIKFEITESGVMRDVDYSLKIMEQMKQKGFAISIDDFGTGYSSFSYLQKFPIDYLKIDLSFIRNMTLNTDSKNIVESIINIAHLLNLKTIAEGVEKELELELLNKMGNDYIQGYYFNPPVAEAKITEFYQQNNF
jgi:PAS domain S-box-containing protein/diguanylate cyclase (GGDEF)-like protein